MTAKSLTKVSQVARALMVVGWLVCITGSARAVAYAVRVGWIDAGILTLSVILTAVYLLAGWAASRKGWL